jgi:inner membrane protein
MDTLTHALSGALIARATAPRAAGISLTARVSAGAVACAFPDSDVVLSLFSPVTYLTQHRGVTHSLLLAPLWALALGFVFAQIHRGEKQASWRDFYAVSLLALLSHIAGDLITSFGTMIYAPISDARVAWNLTFIIDLWLSGIIVAGLAASWFWRRSRLPACVGIAALTAYVGFQAVQHQRALAFGKAYAEGHASTQAAVSALPGPVTPFNWMIIVTDNDLYHYAYVNLRRPAPLPPPGPDAGLITRVNAGYAPLAQARWIMLNKYGPDPNQRELVQRALAHPELGFYRWFAEYPLLYRIDRGNPATCVWFQDLRFAIPGREASSFRYGLCNENRTDQWSAFRLRNNGRREPAG